MAAAFTVDVIDGGDFIDRYDQQTGQTLYSGTRVAIVRGLTDGSAGQTATALIRARNLIAATYPNFTPYDSSIPQCYVIGHRSEGLNEDSDGARVRIIYDTPLPGGSPGSGGTPFVMTDNTETQFLTTQLDPATGQPLWVVWADPGNVRNKIQDIATVTLPYKVRRVSLDAILPNASMPAYRTAEGTVNDDNWAPAGETASDYPIGFWAFDAMRTSTVVGSLFYRVHIELATKMNPKEDWSTYALLRNPMNGHFVADKTSAAALHNRITSPYLFGVRGGNGIIKVGGFDLSDFSTLFAGI